MERSLVTLVLAVSALLGVGFVLVREGSGLVVAAGALLGLAGLAGLLLLVRTVAADAKRGAAR